VSDLDGKAWDLDSVDVTTLISKVLDASAIPMSKWDIEKKMRTMVGSRIVAWPDLNFLQWREAYEFLVASGAATVRDVRHVELFEATAKPRSPVGPFIGSRGLLRGATIF
jgi:hypothetical protein